MTNFKFISDSELLIQTKSLVAQERNLLIQVLHHLREIESRKLFLERGYSSLFSFCVEYLGYDESQAQRRISAARLLKEIPEVEKKIESGSLNLTALTQAQSFFRQEAKTEKPMTLSEKKDVLGLLENKTTRECEKELIKLRPEALPQKQEKTRRITEDYSELKLIIKNDTLEKLKKLKDILSNRGLSLQDLVDLLADDGLKKYDPALKDQPKNKSHAAPNAESRSRYIPSNIRRQVWKRDGGQCTFVDPLTKKECGSRFRLHMDHIKPRAAGGTNTSDNLRLQCANHNALRAIQFYGKEKMNAYMNR
jgi:hypothetical protein